jgi:hypothetical protein
MFKSTNLLFFFLFLLLFILYFSSCLFGVCCYCFVFVYFETRCLCTALAGLELTILLPQSSECWDYKCVPPHLASFCFLIFLEWIHFMIPLYWLIIFKIILNINGLIKKRCGTLYVWWICLLPGLGWQEARIENWMASTFLLLPFILSLFIYFVVLGYWTQGLHLEKLHQPFFVIFLW